MDGTLRVRRKKGRHSQSGSRGRQYRRMEKMAGRSERDARSYARGNSGRGRGQQMRGSRSESYRKSEYETRGYRADRASGRQQRSGEMADDGRLLNHEQERIQKWLKDVRFKTVLVGGVEESDVWKKINELNALYEAALVAERARYDALLGAYGDTEAAAEHPVPYTEGNRQRGFEEEAFSEEEYVRPQRSDREEKFSEDDAEENLTDADDLEESSYRDGDEFWDGYDDYE